MKNICLIIILMISTTAYSVQVDLLSLEAERKTTGDLVTFKVDSELEYEELLKYKNKRVGDILYILEVNRDGSGIFVRGMLAKPELNKITGKNEDVQKNEFKIKNLNYEPKENEKLKDFIIYNGPEIKFSEESKRIGLIATIVLLSIFLWFGVRGFLNKRKIKRKEIKRVDDLENLIKSYNTKEGFELFYKNRKLLKNDFYFDQDKLEQFINHLNLIQYKECWSSSELEETKKLYTELSRDIGRKNGI